MFASVSRRDFARLFAIEVDHLVGAVAKYLKTGV